MCGIAGVVETRGAPVDIGIVRAMTAVLAHRGPDGEGHVCRGPVGLGHRRLAIIDLAAGAQPMANEDESVWISYNGEVYNFRELRDELQARGFRFRTNSDTEVILRAYEAHGPDCVKKLRGMFAFAIWDARRRQIFLARDRAGIKPLVYAWDGERLLFASELKAILQHPSIRRELDWDALRDYFTYLYVPSPWTIFKAVRKLPPASFLLLSVDGGAPEISRYWDLQIAPDFSVSESEWTERLKAVLFDTVKRHMVSDVPIGAFLSGGVDSSAVVAQMAKASSAPIKSFSIGFDEADFDELAYARQVSQRYGTDHYEFVVKPDALEVLPRLVWQFDEPFADASALPTYYVSKITREHVTVALSGDGGDENFAGYRRYARAVQLQQRMRPFPFLRPALHTVARLMPEGMRGQGFLRLLGAPPLERYHQMMSFQRRSSLTALLTPEALTRLDPTVSADRFSRLAETAGTRDYLSKLQYVDIHTYLPDDILAKVDRTSMLVSLESRVPLLDHVLMDFVATMPPSMKLRNGTGKHVLKQAMADQLPPEILNRKKMGFGVPLHRWFRHELAEYTRDILLDARARQRGIIRPEAVSKLLQQHQEGRDYSVQIWSLLCFEGWCRTWWDRSPV